MNPADDMASLQNALQRHPAPACDPEPAPDVGAPRPRLQVEVACPACGRAVTLTDDRLADHRPPPSCYAAGPDARPDDVYVPCPGVALRFVEVVPLFPSFHPGSRGLGWKHGDTWRALVWFGRDGEAIPAPAMLVRASEGDPQPPRAPESTWRAVLFRAGSAPVQIAAPSSFEDAVKVIEAARTPAWGGDDGQNGS